MDKLCPHTSCIYSSAQGLSNGLSYGGKVRFTHALVMAILFSNEPIYQKLQRVLKNTTKMEVIAKKTDEMQARALIFKKAGDELHGLARCQNLKWTLILSCVCILLVGGLGYGFYSSINN